MLHLNHLLHVLNQQWQENSRPNSCFKSFIPSIEWVIQCSINLSLLFKMICPCPLLMVLLEVSSSNCLITRRTDISDKTHISRALSITTSWWSCNEGRSPSSCCMRVTLNSAWFISSNSVHLTRLQTISINTVVYKNTVGMFRESHKMDDLQYVSISRGFPPRCR